LDGMFADSFDQVLDQARRHLLGADQLALYLAVVAADVFEGGLGRVDGLDQVADLGIEQVSLGAGAAGERRDLPRTDDSCHRRSSATVAPARFMARRPQYVTDSPAAVDPAWSRPG